MTQEKSPGAKRLTKAGMMAASRRKKAKNDEIATEKDPVATPTISKEKAEENSRDKPLH